MIAIKNINTEKLILLSEFISEQKKVFLFKCIKINRIVFTRN